MTCENTKPVKTPCFNAASCPGLTCGPSSRSVFFFFFLEVKKIKKLKKKKKKKKTISVKKIAMLESDNNDNSVKTG